MNRLEGPLLSLMWIALSCERINGIYILIRTIYAIRVNLYFIVLYSHLITRIQLLRIVHYLIRKRIILVLLPKFSSFIRISKLNTILFS